MILVAGIGNVLLGDDGFGVEVVRRLAAKAPAGAHVVDFGIRGLDLAHALLEPYDAAILVDASKRGRPPGTLYVIEPDAGLPAAVDMHGADPVRVLQMAKAMGPTPGTLRVVACEPGEISDEELSMELSPPVAAAIDPAVRLVENLIAELSAHA